MTYIAKVHENLSLTSLPNEIWKDIPEYKGYYQVSNLGRVKSLSRKQSITERILRQQVSNHKYVSVSLKILNKAKRFQTHQLVAIAFLNHKPNGFEKVVDHINNNSIDNRLENLQIITNRENSSKDKKNGTSKYIGVSWRESSKRWRSAIYHQGKSIELGYFKDEKEASRYYQAALTAIKEGKTINKKPQPTQTSSYTGVLKCKTSSKWKASISINNKKIWLGSFNTEEEAAEKRKQAEEDKKNGIAISPTRQKPTNSNKGIIYAKDKSKWRAVIWFNKRNNFIGYYDNEDDAVKAREKALNKLKLTGKI